MQDRYNSEHRFDTLILGFGAILVLLYFYRLGGPAFWSPNEAFYAETPREMMQRGDFLVPYFNGEFRFNKPPLLYWLVIPWYFILGLTEAAPRMVSALSATGGIFLTYWLGKTVWESRRAGLLSAIILAAAFDYNANGRYASPELLLTFLTTAGLAAFYRGFLDTAGHRQRWYLLAYGICGLATLTKGPIGLLLPGLVVAAFFAVRRDWKGFREAISVPGIFLYLTIAVPWYAYMITTHGDAFTSVVFGENITRFAAKKSRTSSPLYYFTVLPWNFFPGSVYAIPALIGLRRVCIRDHKVLFPLVWFAAVFIFFSFSKSKLPPYIYALFPALAVIAGGWIKGALEEGTRQGTIFLWLSALIACVAAAGLFWIRTYLPDISAAVLSVSICLVVLGLFAIWKKLPAAAVVTAFGAMALFYFAFLGEILPQIERYRPYREMSAAVESVDPAGTSPFYCYGVYQQSFVFYLKRNVTEVRDGEVIDRLIKSNPEALIMIDEDLYEERYRDAGRRVIWSGPFYHRSESRFMKFLLDIKKGGIRRYVLLG